jgi:hypothetical protein
MDSQRNEEMIHHRAEFLVAPEYPGSYINISEGWPDAFGVGKNRK